MRGLRGAAAIAAGTAALAAAGAWVLVRRVVVEGDSMAPAIRPGDHLAVLRLPAWAPLRRGQVVAVPDPRAPARLLVKRVRDVGPEGVVLEGDNAPASTDSRHFGPVRRRAVIGTVLYRYAPAERAGRLPAVAREGQSVAAGVLRAARSHGDRARGARGARGDVPPP